MRYLAWRSRGGGGGDRNSKRRRRGGHKSRRPVAVAIARERTRCPTAFGNANSCATEADVARKFFSIFFDA